MATFQGLPSWVDECNRFAADVTSIPRLLIGNKCDCIERKQVSNF